MYTFDELLALTTNEIEAINLPSEPVMLYEPIRYSLSCGGKRIRPVALLMGCNVFSDTVHKAMPAALAIEVFHNFTLLHDDIMDNASTRRGEPTVHKKWNENIAILSGDAMMIYAYELLRGSDSKLLPQLLSVFNRVAMGVCEGQQMDMDFEHQRHISVEQYSRMIELKTAILLAGALQIGAICGGATIQQSELLYNFGVNIGLAFQLQDDLLDCYADPTVFGKAIGGDIVAGKKSFLLTTALSNASQEQRKQIYLLLEDSVISDDQKIKSMLAIYDTIDVRSHTEKMIETYFVRALELLEKIDTGIERTYQLKKLAALLLDRKK